MDSKAKDALLLNRVKIMKFCDYFVVSAPLIAKKILPMDKHKEFKTKVGSSVDPKGDNNARMDSLLEFMDECSTLGAFDAFVEGVKNCEGQKTFAKVLKKTAEGTERKRSPVRQGPVQAKPRVKGVKRLSSTLAPFSLAFPGSSISPPTYEASKGLLFVSTPVVKKPKKSGGARKSLVLNGPILPGITAPPVASSLTPSSAKPRQLAKPRKKPAPNIQLNGRGLVLKPTLENASTPSAEPAKKKAAPRKKANTKLVAPGPILQAFTPHKFEFDSGPSSSAKGAAPAKNSGPSSSTAAAKSTTTSASSSKKQFTRVPVGSPFKPRNGLNSQSKLKKMTFQEVEDKQKSASRATTFSFINSSAIVKTIHFHNKSDLFYEGCPTRTNNQLCARKVQLKGKGKKYVCKEKHENESYELFPRLYVTFEDNTTHMQTTLFRENVEVLAGKPVSDIHRLDDETLKTEFLKAHNRNIPIEVKCKKILKKDIKKSGGATWENVANIITDSGDGPPPVKRTRKSID